MPQRFELHRDDPGYPAQLLCSPEPPDVLFGIGDPGCLTVALAVVGSRRATPYGIHATRLFAGWAARAGYVVVSGGATGCDQAAHLAALEESAVTVAVMGCGADVAYPRSAAPLFARVGASGAVISEQPWGTEPRPWMFRRRNRIIAGLCGALLVAEAGLPSGTFTTADDALAAGREVLAVPGSITSPSSAGANRLIRQGATPITDVTELHDALLSAIGPPPRETSREVVLCDPSGDPILAAVHASPLRPDDISRELAIDIVTVSRRLGRLESLGLVARYDDGRYGPGGRR